MKDEAVTFNRRLALLILASFTILVAAVVLCLGLQHTPYDATDSAGHPMGFNDRFGAEHYLIMLQNFAPVDLLKPERGYEWVLLGAHVIGALLLLTSPRVPVRLIRWFFAVQPLLFPFGVFGALYLPLFLIGTIGAGGFDRETFIDLPFIVCTAHAIWVLVSLFLVIALRGPGLGLARVWSGIAQTTRVGTQRGVDAIR